MQNQGTTIDPISGKIYRIVAPKARTAAFAALEAAVTAAKEAQASYMRSHNLAYDQTRRITVVVATGEAPADAAIVAELQRLLTATKAAQSAVKAYKVAHPGEFTPQERVARGIPVVNRPARGGAANFRGRGRGRGG